MGVEVDVGLNRSFELLVEGGRVYALSFAQIVGEVGRVGVKDATWTEVTLTQVRDLVLAQILVVIRGLEPLPVTIVTPLVLGQPPLLLHFLGVELHLRIRSHLRLTLLYRWEHLHLSPNLLNLLELALFLLEVDVAFH